MTPNPKDAQMKIRLPQDLLDAAKAKADAEDIPLSQVVRQLLKGWMSEPARRTGTVKKKD